MLWFSGPEACGVLAPRPLEGEVLTTGLPGNSVFFCFFLRQILLGNQEGAN